MAFGVFSAHAQLPPQATPADPPAALEAAHADIHNSALDADLFYGLLLSELMYGHGQRSLGYDLMLEAARRSGEAQLYRRATEMALELRSDKHALIAVSAWLQAQPQSREANRYMLQILLIINRVADTIGPLQQEWSQASESEKIDLLHALPQLYFRVSDKAMAARVVEQALAADLADPNTSPLVWVTVGRMRWIASDLPGALQAARRAHALNALDESVAELALGLMDEGLAEAEPLLSNYFAGTSVAVQARIAYARLLSKSGRLIEAQTQTQAAVREHPDVLDAWLLLASLHLQVQRLDEAQTALDRFAQLLDALPASHQPAEAQVQLYLMRSQLAEKRNDFPLAEQWLARIEEDIDPDSMRYRRAYLLARQNKLAQALELIRSAPSTNKEEQYTKLLLETQLLREIGQHQQAYESLTRAVALTPHDDDLTYDLAMLADKAGHPADMERLLHEIIARTPDNYHALNALGFSLADRGIRLQEAKALITKALEHAPKDPFITDSLGWVEFRLGNMQEALRLLNMAFQQRPHPEVAAHLGEVLWLSGQRERALSVWREGLRLDKEDTALQDTLKRLGVQP